MKTWRYFLSVFLMLAFFSATAQKKNIKSDTIMVLGTCEQCKDRIESNLSELGVYKSNWDIKSNLLTVNYDSTKLSIQKIEKKLAEVGHDTKDYQADEVTYDDLPACCHYERYVIERDSVKSEADTTSIKHEKGILIGVVLEEDVKGKLLPLYSATVHWLNTNVAVITDTLGVFKIPVDSLPSSLVISYVGYESDTILIETNSKIKIILKNSSSYTLKEIEIQARQRATFVSSLSTENTLNITSKELAKAACCNLSESFETSPSVDVSYSDAVTGIKQIQLLGLSGTYTLLTTENIPEMRGLAGAYGLTFIPGTWVDGIQVTKGTGSVANGYESIAGQINIEEKKPDNSERVFANVYANYLGRLEGTANFTQKINDKWATTLLTHSNGVVMKNDNNRDGFLDMPVGHQWNVINRWKFDNSKGLEAQVGFKALNDVRQAGQVNFDPNSDKLSTNTYGVGIINKQYQAFGKIGFVFPHGKYKSIGLMFSTINYTNNSYYGINKYDGIQQSIYANIIYQSILNNTNHKFRTGLSFINDSYNETFANENYKRLEVVPGAFFEYTFSAIPKFTAIAGIREDYHNQYGFLTTPRLNFKYDLNKNSIIRASAGYGLKVANIFSENTGFFISSRQYSIINTNSNYGYGLNLEKAWNYGVNYTFNFKINEREGNLNLNAYRTDFADQVIVDLDADSKQIIFYNLRGKSFSNSLQAEINYELIKNLDLRIAFRWLDVETTYHGKLLQKPLTAQNRAFINLAYETGSLWKFDFTTQWIGSKRLPNTSSNPADMQFSAYSPSYIQMATQVTKQFGSKWDLYLGVENLTNYVQKNLIISANQPFGQYFDASMIWGPVNGRIVYIGLRFKID